MSEAGYIVGLFLLFVAVAIVCGISWLVNSWVDATEEREREE